MGAHFVTSSMVGQQTGTDDGSNKMAMDSAEGNASFSRKIALSVLTSPDIFRLKRGEFVCSANHYFTST